MKIDKVNVRTAEAAVSAAPLDPAGDTPVATTPNGAAIRLYHWIAILVPIIISSCAAPDTQHHIVISTREQKLALLTAAMSWRFIPSPLPSSVSAIGGAAG